MVSTIIAIIIAIVTGTTPAQPNTPNSNPQEKSKTTTTEDGAVETLGGIGQWDGN